MRTILTAQDRAPRGANASRTGQGGNPTQWKLFVRIGLMAFAVGLWGLAGDANAQTTTITSSTTTTTFVDTCCPANPAAIGFVTLDPGSDPAKCGQMSNYRCAQPGTCTSIIPGFNQKISTKIGLLKFGGAPPVGRLYKLVSKAPTGGPLFSLPGSSPATTGGSLTVTIGSDTLSCTLASGLFNGTVGWKELGSPAGSKGYKYINKLAPTDDPCKIIIVKAKVIKILAKGTGDLPLPVDFPPGSGELSTVLSFGDDDYCALWAAPHFKEKADSLLKAKSQAAPSFCPDYISPRVCVLDSDCPLSERPCVGEGNSNFLTNMCSPEGPEDQCDFGPCFITPPVCAGATAIACSQDSDCVGTCLERTSEGFPVDLDCGGLYTGGGLNSVPLPLTPPDRGVAVQAVTDCTDGMLTLGPIGQSAIGPNYGPDGQGLNCTQGKKCDPGISPNPNGLDGNGLCEIEEDCGCVFGGGCCVEHCLFGPPLPIPNAVTPPTSVCVRNVIANSTSGTVDCQDGGANITIPIASVIHVTGDLLNKSEGRDVPGLQTCPLCSKVCIGGTETAGFPCENDSDCDSNTCSGSEECIAGPRDGLPCTPHTSRLDVHKCCFNGNNNLQRCETDADCAAPPGPAPRCELSFDPCTDDSDCLVFPGDSCIKCVPGCTSFPTSHDCPPDPGADITFRIGGLPIDFSLTDQLNELEAADLSTNGRRAFCGYCRDVSGAGTLCFEGDLDTGCPAAIPPADGNGVPCTSDADCAADRCLDGINRNVICGDDSDCPGSTCIADTDEYESCAQRNPGAFSKAAATTFWSQGSTDGEPLSDNQCHDATLVGIFCIPPTFDATIDNAGDLPGAGMSNLIGRQRLAADPADLDPGITGTEFCSPGTAFVDVTSGVLD